MDYRKHSDESLVKINITKYKTWVILQVWLKQSHNKLLYFHVQRNGDLYPSQRFLGRQTYLLWFSFKCYVTPTVYELVWPQELFGWPPDHMGWFALLLLVKFKTPGWFYFISYIYQVFHFGGWEHCVKVWWVTRSKSKVSRPLFSLVLVAGDVICFVVKLNENGAVKQTRMKSTKKVW